MRDVIVTGIPRSGTTLAASLIDSLPDTVCLNEPGWHNARSAPTPEGFAQFIQKDFARLRRQLVEGEPVPDRRAGDGSATTNYYRVEGGKMESNFEVLPFTRPGLSAEFTLAIKHNGPYLAVLPQLIALKGFTFIAIVRHPVEVLHSWRSLSLPISEGNMPNAAPYWPELTAVIASPAALLEKQVRIYDLMCARIYALREHLHVVPYETLVQAPGILSGCLGMPVMTDASRIKPSRPVPEEVRAEIIAAVKAHGTHYKHFYPDI